QVLGRQLISLVHVDRLLETRTSNRTRHHGNPRNTDGHSLRSGRAPTRKIQAAEDPPLPLRAAELDESPPSVCCHSAAHCLRRALKFADSILNWATSRAQSLSDGFR